MCKILRLFWVLSFVLSTPLLGMEDTPPNGVTSTPPRTILGVAEQLPRPRLSVRRLNFSEAEPSEPLQSLSHDEEPSRVHQETIPLQQARLSLSKFLQKLGVNTFYFESTIAPAMREQRLGGSTDSISLSELNCIFNEYIRGAFLSGCLQTLSVNLQGRGADTSTPDSSLPGPSTPKHMTQARACYATPLEKRTMGSIGLPCLTPAKKLIASLTLETLLNRLISNILVAPIGSIDGDLQQLVNVLFRMNGIELTCNELLIDEVKKIKTKHSALSPIIDEIISHYFYLRLSPDERRGHPHYNSSIDKEKFTRIIDACDLTTWLHFEPGCDRLAAMIRHLIFNIHCYRSSLLDPLLSQQTNIFYCDAIRLYHNVEIYIESALMEYLRPTNPERHQLLFIVLQKAYDRVAVDFKNIIGITDGHCLSFAYKKLLILAKAIETELSSDPTFHSKNLPIKDFTFLKDAHGYQVTIEKGTDGAASGGHFMLQNLKTFPCPAYMAIDLYELPTVMKTLLSKRLVVKEFTPLYTHEASGVVLGDWRIHDKITHHDESPKESGLFPDCYKESYLEYVKLLNDAIIDPSIAQRDGIVVYQKHSPCEADNVGTLMTCKHKQHNVFLIKHPHALGCKDKTTCKHSGKFMYVTLYKHVDEFTLAGRPTFEVTTINSVFPMVIFNEDESRQQSFKLDLQTNAQKNEDAAITAQIDECKKHQPMAPEWREKRNRIETQYKPLVIDFSKKLVGIFDEALRLTIDQQKKCDEDLKAAKEDKYDIEASKAKIDKTVNFYERSAKFVRTLEICSSKTSTKGIIAGLTKTLETIRQTNPELNEATNTFLLEIEEISNAINKENNQIEEEQKAAVEQLKNLYKQKDQLALNTVTYEPLTIPHTRIVKILDESGPTSGDCYDRHGGQGSCQLIEIAPHIYVIRLAS